MNVYCHNLVEEGIGDGQEAVSGPVELVQHVCLSIVNVEGFRVLLALWTSRPRLSADSLRRAKVPGAQGQGGEAGPSPVRTNPGRGGSNARPNCRP
jgi:hypothetical protein